MKLRLPENSVLDRCVTEFDWKPCETNPLQGWKKPHYKIGKFLQGWSCQNDQLFILRYDSTEIPLEYVVFKNKSILYRRGPSTSLEHAAEKCYQLWFEMLTSNKCWEALRPKVGRKVVLFGQWISYDEILNNPSKYKGKIYPGDDSRNNLSFLVGYGNDKIEAEIVREMKVNASSHIEHEFLLDSGFVIKTSFDWRMRKPEQYIKDEVMCMNDECKAIGYVHQLKARYVHGVGLLCGICFDYKIGDTEEITDKMVDDDL